jgi:pyrroline-5-carboxylate reductase
MNQSFSFIGVGNMGGAILAGACRAAHGGIFITDYLLEKASETAKRLGVTLCESNESAARAGNIIFLCVKPQILPGVLQALSPVLHEELKNGKSKCLVSIAAGIQISAIRDNLSGAARDVPIIRVMPNITASVGKGMIAVALEDSAPGETVAAVKELLSHCGRVDILPETLMDQFTVVSGCLPAYVFMFIEAVADGAVMTGLPRDKAMEYAAATVVGSATMLLEQGRHPGALKDAVCSPGGSTIAGLAQLERGAFRSTVIDAFLTAYRRNVELGNIVDGNPLI